MKQRGVNGKLNSERVSSPYQSSLLAHCIEMVN
jgi:hypothetical protein